MTKRNWIVAGTILILVIIIGMMGCFIFGLMARVTPSNNSQPEQPILQQESQTDRDTTLGGNFRFMEGNDCSQDSVAVIENKPEQQINFKEIPQFANDEARSVMLVDVSSGTTLRIFDSPEGKQDDDWTTIMIKKQTSSYCVTTFERSYEDEFVQITYHKKNGLDGKVSRIEIN